MTRVVFYNHTAQISGAEKMLLVLLAGLPRSLFEPVLVCPEAGPLPRAAADLGVPIHPGPAVQARYTYNPLSLVRYVWSVLRSVKSLREQLASLHPDIIHANTVRAGILATLATSGTKTVIVWHVHDMLPVHPVTAAVRVLAYSSARIHVAGCSAAAAKTIAPFFSRTKRPVIIHNGLEIGAAFGERGRRAKREELGLEPDAFAIGIVGQVTPRKGQLELIRAFVEVKAQLPAAVLLICGAPQFNNDIVYLARVRQEVRSRNLEDCVRFLGYRTDAREVIGALDLCVVNSSKEPFSLILIEAMAMGTPLVATDSGGPAEIIRHGVQGELVPFGDHAAMVRSVVRIAKDADLRERYRAAALVRVREAFTTEHYIAKWCDFYQGLGRPAQIPGECAGLQEREMQFESRGPR